MITLTHVGEGIRFFIRRVRVGLFGIRKYDGNVNYICQQIVEGCWNKQKGYFMVSSGHYCEFYSRDFGWCTSALLGVGASYKSKVRKSLEYALSVFEKVGGIHVAINPNGRAFNFPNYDSIDSIAYIFRSLRLLGDVDLILEFFDFLQGEITRCCGFIDSKTGLVRKDMRFSSMKDYSLRKSSCYDNCCIGLLFSEIDLINKLFKKSSKKISLNNPFSNYNYKKLLNEHFWTGNYFLNDLSGDNTVCGDANIYPFWFEIFDGKNKDKKMLQTVIKSIEKKGLDKPLPLMYNSKFDDKEHNMIFLEWFVPGWERNSIWSMMGMKYIELVSFVDKKKALRMLDLYAVKIKEYKNFIELYDSKGTGRAFSSLFYHADGNMLWAGMYLDLVKKLRR
ncbi:hypothetical protein HOK51_02655 [Candidatus Woesearchaeota archaeon]|mgnify:CR=1 FL=1|jgi:hypothetical protein|nr:hypothetical protein [Candidatus Woesearchaeota archaeon]MBT6518719.1 hypothetical protein [Candidatus Woesearchaeota archaeon]MBT7367890.1 hypothetical protein [Candidatus Woesearchaeota archaeon]